MKLPVLLAATGALLAASPALAAPQVVASIKPVHALVASVMAGVGEPTLLVQGAASPHDYALRPSDASALEAADLVFWTGHGLELFLEDALDTLAIDAQVVELAESPGIELLPVREGGAFEAHSHAGEDDHDHDHAEHDHDHDAHDHEDHDDHDHEAADDHAHPEGDMHFWLDPQNAIVMVETIATELSAADPENAAAYAANAETTIADLETLTEDLLAQLAPIADRPFLVFHDAYQYFEARFDLTVAGSVTVSPEVAPGAQRVQQLRATIAELGATCIFAEPNFEPAIASTIAEGTEASVGVLDPEGADLTPGPDLYGELLRGIADDLVACLEPQS
jgi:zinc transport system substrate-binding protein